MIAFWVAAALLSAAVAMLIVSRAARAADRPRAEDPTLGVYRRQLAEIDDLADRGLLPETEHRSARTEAARRLLAAAGAKAPPAGASGASRLTVIALAATAPLVALGVYMVVGSPQTPDQPFAKRLAAWRADDPATLGPPEMAAVLQKVSEERPNDPAALFYLARAQIDSGDPASAEQALRKAVLLAPNRSELWQFLGETIAMQTAEGASPEARADYQHAIALDPTQPGPRYSLGRDQIASGEVKAGVATWQALAASLPANDPSRAELLRRIAYVEKTGALPNAQAADPGEPIRRP